MDSNLKEFIDNWHLFRDRVVFLLGAGASYGAMSSAREPLPSGYELRNRLWQALKVRPGEAFDPAELKLMPLEHAAAIVESKAGRQELVRYLTDQFTCERPLWQHLVLPEFRAKALLTTNYDELVELGYRAHNSQQLDVICDDRHPTRGHVPLYKPHGSLSHSGQSIGCGGLVITQFDYFRFIEQYRGMLRQAMTGFNAACVVAVGYSFSDMDIGAELFRLRHSTPGTPWYAIFPRADEQVRKMYSRELRIEQIDATFEDFLVQLDDAVDFISEPFKFERKSDLQRRALIQ